MSLTLCQAAEKFPVGSRVRNTRTGHEYEARSASERNTRGEHVGSAFTCSVGRVYIATTLLGDTYVGSQYANELEVVSEPDPELVRLDAEWPVGTRVRFADYPEITGTIAEPGSYTDSTSVVGGAFRGVDRAYLYVERDSMNGVMSGGETAARLVRLEEKSYTQAELDEAVATARAEARANAAVRHRALRNETYAHGKRVGARQARAAILKSIREIPDA